MPPFLEHRPPFPTTDLDSSLPPDGKLSQSDESYNSVFRL